MAYNVKEVVAINNKISNSEEAVDIIEMQNKNRN